MRAHEFITKILDEYHHKFTGDIDYEHNPLKHDDTITVYHGFRSLDDAILTAKYGLSGAEKIPRVYSYESDNNPRGLFVSPIYKTAKYFAGIHIAKVVMEFDAKLSELEAPVWPGGSWTGFGQYSKYFGHGISGRVERNKRRREEERTYREMPDSPKWVKLSDNPHLAYLLTSERETQALFVGHLNPSRITVFHITDIVNQRDGDSYTLSREEFLEKFQLEKESERSRKLSEKVFSPDEPFNGELFKQRLHKKYPSVTDEFFKRQYDSMIEQNNKVSYFLELFGYVLWPKQIPDAFNWFKRSYRHMKNT